MRPQGQGLLLPSHRAILLFAGAADGCRLWPSRAAFYFSGIETKTTDAEFMRYRFGG